MIMITYNDKQSHMIIAALIINILYKHFYAQIIRKLQRLPRLGKYGNFVFSACFKIYVIFTKSKI